MSGVPLSLRVAAGRIGFAALLAVLVLAGTLAVRPGTLGIPLNHVIVSGDSMEPTYSDGDLVVTLRRSDYGIGDVVAYRAPSDGPRGPLIIHRIVAGDGRKGFVYQGDNRDTRDPWQLTSEHVLGEAVGDVPGIGLALAFLRQPLGFAVLAAFFSFFFIVRRPAPRAARLEHHPEGG